MPLINRVLVWLKLAAKGGTKYPRKLRLLAVIFGAMLLWWAIPGKIALARSENLGQQSVSSIQPYLDRVIKKVTEFSLENGMKFIVLERHEAPVVSFITYADVGGANEPDGKTGVAHFLEHLAFKGTTRIGTKDYKTEKPLLQRLEKLSEQIKTAKAAGKETEATKLKAEFDQIETEAANLVVPNEFGTIVQKEGGVGLNATTSTDATRYFYSFPSNKLELWMSLESERFLEPVLNREFYKEQQVILEERRLRTDNSPIGQMVEVFLDKAYQVHPYRRPVIGYNQELRNLTPTDIKDFFNTHYVPSNLTIAIVGDVNPAKVKDLAQTYFGRYQAKPKPKDVEVIEPPQTASKEFSLQLNTQPWYLEGYHRPAMKHPDHVVYELIGDILSNGRTSRLYKSLIEQKQLALNAQGFSGFPGDKYPNLMLFYAMTAPGHTVEEVAGALRQEIDRLKTEPVSQKELDRVKTQAKAGLLNSLDSNNGMASLLVEYQVKTGSWRNLFKEIDAINKVTAADIQRVAQATFRPENRTVGRLLSKS